jgi:hypothetical protein
MSSSHRRRRAVGKTRFDHLILLGDNSIELDRIRLQATALIIIGAPE